MKPSNMVMVLDLASNTYVDTESFLSGQSPEVASALRKGVQRIEADGEITGTNVQGLGPGRWAYSVVENGSWKPFYLALKTALDSTITGTLQTLERIKNPDGTESTVSVITSGEFSGSIVHCDSGSNPGRPGEETQYATYTIIKKEEIER